MLIDNLETILKNIVQISSIQYSDFIDTNHVANYEHKT